MRLSLKGELIDLSFHPGSVLLHQCSQEYPLAAYSGYHGYPTEGQHWQEEPPAPRYQPSPSYTSPKPN